MKKIQKNKGITLSSLVIYITVMFVVLAIIIKVVTTFRSNMNEVTDVSFESEFEKLNMYMLTETQKSGNAVLSYNQDGDNISFRDLSSLEFRDEDEDGIGEIYYKDNNGKEIKLCNNVNDFEIEVINENTNTVTIKISITINNIQREKTYVITNVIQEVILPDEYQQVEYIESTGTQYINTGVKTSSGVIEQETEIMTQLARQLSGSNFGWWFGVSDTNYYNAPGITSTISPSQNSFDRVKLVTDYTNSQKTLTINGEEFTSDTTIGNTGLGEAEIYIFKISNYQYSDTTQMSGKIKFYKITVDNVLVRDFIPCYRKSDGEIGLYDLIERKFYTKSSGGTENFLKGKDIITKNPYRQLEYIESTRTQLINTEYKPKRNTKVELTLSLSGTFNYLNRNYIIWSRL